VLSRQPRPLIAYVAVLVLVAVSLCVLLVGLGYRLESPLVVLCLAAATAVAERWSVPLSATTDLTVYLLPTVFAAVVFGPLPAAVIAAASMLGDPELFRRGDPARAPRLKWANYTATSFITGAVAGLTAQAFIGSSIGSIVIATFAAMAAAEASDFVFAITTSQVRRRSMHELAGRIGPVALTSFLVYAPVVVGLVVAYTRVSPLSILLFVVPTLAFQRLYALYQRERTLSDELRTANETLAGANLSFAVALVTALEASDAYTAGHSRAVAIYCRDIALRMSLSPEDCDRAFLCGLVHDIGKVGLPPSLLGKDGPLTLEERRSMQEHSVIGERILREVAAYDDVATIVRHHHERMDGEGYPDGIHGEHIPLLSRVIAVADAYNAMTSHRPYREAMPPRVARLRLAQAVENQFDTSVVAAFEAILASSSEGYKTARSEEFRPGQPSTAEGPDASSRELVAGAA
jgi:HD-GYP domain-containing protein (c-di-GMP phosphodiesterase class II)